MLLTDAVAEMKAKMGGEAELGPWLKMNPGRIDDFAQAKDDFQLIQIDQKRAEPLPMDF